MARELLIENGKLTTDLDANHKTIKNLDGFATLEDGVVPARQLPAAYDDVDMFASASSFPEAGVDGRIYVAKDTNSTYRWNGTQYVQIGGSAITTDATVTRTSANPVKSSGIWSAIWGALEALPTGFTTLYDWVVAQLAGKLSTNGGAMTGDLDMRGHSIHIGDRNEYMGMYGNNFDIVLGSAYFLFNNDSENASTDEDVMRRKDLADKADAADLRYRITETAYDPNVGEAGGYILADRTVNLITADDETSIDIELPAPVEEPTGVRRARDFYLDVDNSANASDLALEFTALGMEYAFAPLEGDSISEMMTIGAGERARLYFTEMPYIASALPVIQVLRVTLGDFVTSTTPAQGGN